MGLSERDAKRQMNRKIIRNINFLMSRSEQGKKYSQRGFVQFCLNTYGDKISQGNLSKLLNSDSGNVHPLILYYMSQYLGVDMKTLVEDDLSVSEEIIDLFSNQTRDAQKNIIYKLPDEVFNFYCGEYSCYFYPTKSDENEIIQGKLKIEKDWENNYCHVFIEINTNSNIEGTDEPYIKKYEGHMFMSMKLKICYCIVHNDELGECNFISFRYLGLNNTKYQGGMAAVLTTSAGSDNVPTMHRMLISRKEINDEMLEQFKGNLLLNYSNIIVEEEQFENVMLQFEFGEDVINNLINNLERKTYYIIREGFFHSTKNEKLTNINRLELVAQLRAVSSALRYNKISKKLDENIVKLLSAIRIKGEE